MNSNMAKLPLPEVIKVAKGVLLQDLYDVLFRCRMKKSFPQDLRNSK